MTKDPLDSLLGGDVNGLKLLSLNISLLGRVDHLRAVVNDLFDVSVENFVAADGKAISYDEASDLNSMLSDLEETQPDADSSAEKLHFLMNNLTPTKSLKEAHYSEDGSITTFNQVITAYRAFKKEENANFLTIMNAILTVEKVRGSAEISEVPEKFATLEEVNAWLSIDENLKSLTNINHIFLTRLNITILPRGIFDNFSNLKKILIMLNPLKVLPKGVFDNLNKLQMLFLEKNRLETLPTGVFDSLINLELLYLHRNKLVTLSPGIFDKLTKLQVLTLKEKNKFVELPVGVFDKLTRLDPSIKAELYSLENMVGYLQFERSVQDFSENSLFKALDITSEDLVKKIKEKYWIKSGSPTGATGVEDWAKANIVKDRELLKTSFADVLTDVRVEFSSDIRALFEEGYTFDDFKSAAENLYHNDFIKSKFENANAYMEAIKFEYWKSCNSPMGEGDWSGNHIHEYPDNLAKSIVAVIENI